MKAEKMIGETRKILLSFLSDTYQPLEEEHRLTRQALTILARLKLNNQILTKGSYALVHEDFPLMKKAKTELGITLCFADDEIRKKWEPCAGSVEDRLRILKEALEAGVYTWCSLEPVIDPEQALEVIRQAVNHVDFWKVGKLNHMPDVESRIDWKNFAKDVVSLLESKKAKYYIKDDLRKYL